MYAPMQKRKPEMVGSVWGDKWKYFSKILHLGGPDPRVGKVSYRALLPGDSSIQIEVVHCTGESHVYAYDKIDEIGLAINKANWYKPGVKREEPRGRGHQQPEPDRIAGTFARRR